MLKWLLGIGLLACVWSAPAEAACGPPCFWKGGTASGAVANTANWSLSSGGAACTCTPTTTDAVILDSASTSPMLINTALSVGTFDASGTGGSGSPYTGTITHSTGVSLTINTAATNSLMFSTQLTYTPATSTAVVTFANTSGNAVITSNGKNFGGITVNGVGGTAQQADDLSITAVASGQLVVTNGVFDANGHATAAGIIQSTAANVRGLTLGSSVTIGGNVPSNTSIWNVNTSGTFTFTKNAANIEIITPVSAIQAWTFAGAGLTYNALTVDSNTTTSGTTLAITGSNTFSSVTVGAGWNLILAGGLTQTLSGNLAITGTSAKWSSILSGSTASTTAFAVTGTCTLVYTVLLGVAESGTACTAIPGINLGTTTGVTVTAPSGGGGGYIIGN